MIAGLGSTTRTTMPKSIDALKAKYKPYTVMPTIKAQKLNTLRKNIAPNGPLTVILRFILHLLVVR